ncbi:THO complex subunit 1-like [Camellia sinensis]|uniref:THO complex subunit 1-like n=1 Tax=Camellia sinensis TaxID=4442 RepID=UPI0010362534|nr:THO complex subunit 1-like [Camellia sinensis]
MSCHYFVVLYYHSTILMSYLLLLQNALTDPQRVRTPAVTEYWKPLAEDMDLTAGIEAEYHHKNNRVYCWKGLRFSARQDLDGFSRFTEYGIEGVVPLELLPPDVRSKYQAKPTERSKRAKKEETKGAAHQGDENQIATPASEIDGEGSRVDLEASAAPMDTDAAMTSGNMSQGGTPTQDEQHKQSSDTTTDGGQEEPGQIEADAEQAEAEAEAGMIDGEIDAEVDLDAVG